MTHGPTWAILEELVAKHGEKHRALIADALEFLDEHEPRWKANWEHMHSAGPYRPVNREQYIASMIEKKWKPLRKEPRK